MNRRFIAAVLVCVAGSIFASSAADAAVIFNAGLIHAEAFAQANGQTPIVQQPADVVLTSGATTTHGASATWAGFGSASTTANTRVELNRVSVSSNSNFIATPGQF